MPDSKSVASFYIRLRFRVGAISTNHCLELAKQKSRFARSIFSNNLCQDRSESVCIAMGFTKEMAEIIKVDTFMSVIPYKNLVLAFRWCVESLDLESTWLAQDWSDHLLLVS